MGKKTLSSSQAEAAERCDPELAHKPHPALLSLDTANPAPVRSTSQVLISVLFVELSHVCPE